MLYSILCIRLATASKTSAVPIACNMKSAEVEHMGPQTCRVGLRPKVQNLVLSRTSSVQKWRPPPAVGWAKMNVDAALYCNGERGALAVVSRDHTGFYLGASALVCESVADPEILEAMACCEGLSLALDLNLNKFRLAPIVQQQSSISERHTWGPAKLLWTRSR